MPRLEKSYERELRKLASNKDADSYGAWLSAQRETDARSADRARQHAATEAAMALVDYGTSGEALARTGLADDGYADYLRMAAKNAREARVRAIESERASNERKALEGYADYLDGVRKTDGDRLVAAAEELLAMNKPNDARVEGIIRGATDDTRAANMLRLIRNTHEYIPNESVRTDVPSVISHIREMGYSPERAYRYCKVLGYSDERAREVADFATESYAGLADEVDKLFGD